MTELIITSSALILIVTALRYLLKGRISLRLQYALWGLVLLRLLIPVTPLQSPISVMNAVETAASVRDGSPAKYLPASPSAAPPSALGEADSSPGSDVTVGINPDAVTDVRRNEFDYGKLIWPVWYAGIAGVGFSLLLSNLSFSRRLKRTRRVFPAPGCPLPVYVVPSLQSPCLFGLLRPAIYITPDVAEDETRLRHVLVHELTHRRHGDHVWSLLRGVCLAVHWYNPLVWLAASLSRRDSELCCDEAAIKRIGEAYRTEYGRTLIGLTCQKRSPTDLLCLATTMTGDKRAIRERITLIARNPRTLLPVLGGVLLAAAFAVGCTFTGAMGTGSTLRSSVSSGGDVAVAGFQSDDPAALELTLVRKESWQLTAEQWYHGELIAETPLTDGVDGGSLTLGLSADPIQTDGAATGYAAAISCDRDGESIFSGTDRPEFPDGAAAKAWTVAVYGMYEKKAVPVEAGKSYVLAAWTADFTDGVVDGGRSCEEMTEEPSVLSKNDYVYLIRLELLPAGEGNQTEFDALNYEDIRFYLTDPEQAGLTFAREIYGSRLMSLPEDSDFRVSGYELIQYSLYSASDTAVSGAFAFAVKPEREIGYARLHPQTREGKYEGYRILTRSFTLERDGAGYWNCTQIQAMQSPEELGIVLDGSALPGTVLEAVKAQVADYYRQEQESFPEYAYLNWRIESLEKVYTYEQFQGRTLDIYQMNYELLSLSPEQVALAGGMYITEDGWVCPTYPNCTYLVFDTADNTLLATMMENDTSPGLDLFTADLQNRLSWPSEGPVDLGPLAVTGLTTDSDVGVGVLLDYANDDILVFHGYFGLFVYDLREERLVLSVDLKKAVGTTVIQGSYGAAVLVDAEGSVIQLYYRPDPEDGGPENAYYINTSDYSCTYGPYRELSSYYTLDDFGRAPFPDGSVGELNYDDGNNRPGTLYAVRYSRGDRNWLPFQELAQPSEDVEEIRLSLYYKGNQESGNIVYPSSNAEGVQKILSILDGAKATLRPSVNDAPLFDRLIKAELSLRGETVYLYRDGSRYFAEKPYQGVGELTQEAYETILANFGTVRPFPEDMDREQFVPAIQEMLERYRSGNPPENGMEYMFDELPKGTALPTVRSAADFTMEYGDGTEALYLALIPYGEKGERTLIMGLSQTFGESVTGWSVTGVSFYEP